jgi:hypothetical protein
MLRIGSFRSLLVSIDDGFPGEDGGGVRLDGVVVGGPIATFDQVM